MATVYRDGNLDLLSGRVAVLGYGSQGHAHALNLRDSGIDVVVGLHQGSKSWSKAEAAGLKVLSTAEAAAAAEIVMILVPDHVQADLYTSEVAPHMVSFVIGFGPGILRVLVVFQFEPYFQQVRVIEARIVEGLRARDEP